MKPKSNDNGGNKHRVKILHLEDQPHDAEMVSRILRNATITFDLKLVSTREQFTEALEQFKPELILSDHNLPSFNSMEALEILQKSKFKIPFILVTGTVSEEFAVDAMRAGADDYILKDRLQRLPVAVQNVLNKYRLEREKMKSETLLRNIDANSLDMICSVSEDGYFLHVSAASEEILGYAPSELVGKRPFDFVFEDDKKRTIDSANWVMAGNLLNNFENRYTRKDGSLVTLSWSTRWDEAHRVRYGVARDITEKNIADEKIRQAETLLRNIETNSLDVICTIDHAGLFTYVSQASIKVLGYTPHELLGMNFIDLVYEKDKVDTERTANDALNGNDITMFENRYVRKDGSLVTLLWSSHYEEKEQVIYCIAKDVTELKKAEKVIAVERKRLSDLFMNAPVSMCITSGGSHVFELANPIYLKLAGKKDIIGKTAAEVFPELESQGMLTLLDKIYNSGQPFKANELEFKIDRDGNGQLSEVYLNVLQQPFRDVDGNVAGLFHFGIDVTEQVLTRNQIEESEQRYRQIVETAQEGIWVIDEHDKTIFVNKAMLEMVEYGRDEMIGKDIFYFMASESVKKAAEELAHRRTGKGGQYQVKYISKTGKEVWANISANTLFNEDGSYRGSLAMITDITERKKFETTLLRRDNQLMLASEIAGLGYWEYDVLRDTFIFNDQFYNVYKTSAATVGGYTMSSARYTELFVHPDDAEIISKSVVDSIMSGDTHFNFKAEHRIIFSDGENGFISVHFRAVKDENGQTIKHFGVNQNITDRKKEELEKLALIHNLQTKNNNLQQFSYIVSHNLRSPIAKIRGLIQIIDDSPEEKDLIIKMIENEATNLDQVVTDINVIVSARKTDPEKREPVFFDKKLSQIIQVLDNEIIKKGVTITRDFSRIESIVSIKSYIYSIVYNLVSNAIKYRSPDRSLRIHVSTQILENMVCLSVSDNGRGIDMQKYAGKVFGLYKRFHHDSIPGRGVGLHLVRTHAEALGGRAEVESIVNEGSTFKIYLPYSYGTNTAS